jgi:hypothetical protein
MASFLFDRIYNSQKEDAAKAASVLTHPVLTCGLFP